MSVSSCHPAEEPEWGGKEEKPRVALLGPGDRPNILATANRLRPHIEEHVEIVFEDFEYEKDFGDVEIDFVIVLGGDGAILRAAHLMGVKQVPVLGVNLGKLGFLSDLKTEEFLKVLPGVCRGECKVIHHLMFDCSVYHGRELVKRQMGLNEVAILNGPPYSILNVELYVDTSLATIYSCDGLIISTPVGSTAHSLSAGGPILRKNLSAFVISPISPHTLTVRPVIDTADRTYEVIVREPKEHTSVVVDGQVFSRLDAEYRVTITRSENQFQLIEVVGHNFYRTLRDKLGWGGQLQFHSRH
ncbi:MAG: NAD(+)/NADH kinase [Pirellulaceae bacterium]|nr:NAD(+)/NADH kinase [Pirellulaceae bacterium]